jgi:hypothetical protein
MTRRNLSIDAETYRSLESKKANMERILNKKISYDQLLKLMVDQERKVIIAPRGKKRARLDEMWPILKL